MQPRPTNGTRNVDDELRLRRRRARSSRSAQHRNGDRRAAAMEQAGHAEHEQRAKQHDADEHAPLRRSERV